MPTPRYLTQGLLACLALAVTSSAQTPAVQTAPTQTGPQYTIRARVPLTILDIQVADAKGHPVHNLKQSNFTVLEDNQEVKPNSFEEHSTEGPPPPPVANLTLPPDTFTNVTPASPNAGPINVLLLDSLNTPMGVQQIVNQEMLAFIKMMRPGTRMAIFAFNYRLILLQGFTSDPELLRAAITGKGAIPQVPRFEDRGQDVAGPDDPGCIEQSHMEMRGQYTLSAMRQLARYLSGIPGRKNLIWFGGSFPMQVDCDDQYTQVHYDYTPELTSATDQLARAHVVLYPVDGRALDALARGNGGRIAKETNEHLTMEAIAEPTGGKVTYNSNDLAGAVSEAVDNGSNFYTLTYTTPNRNFDTRFRHISVKIDQPGLHLTYRPGYYALDPDTTLSGKKADTVTPMQSALMRGTLDATQILFKVKVSSSSTPQPTLPAGNKPDASMKPPYRLYTLAYAIDVNNIDFAPGPDGNYRGDFEYGVNVFTSDGDEVVNTTSKEVNPILPPAVYQSMLKGGANAHQEIAVPATGDYFLRIAVHDMATGRIGSIEIPTASITGQAAPPAPAISPSK